jgi:hypothetical protein
LKGARAAALVSLYRDAVGTKAKRSMLERQRESYNKGVGTSGQKGTGIAVPQVSSRLS